MIPRELLEQLGFKEGKPNLFVKEFKTENNVYIQFFHDYRNKTRRSYAYDENGSYNRTKTKQLNEYKQIKLYEVAEGNAKLTDEKFKGNKTEP